ELVAPPAGSGPGTAAPPPGAPVSGPANTAAPTIHGSPRQARIVIATQGSWTNDPTAFSYTRHRSTSRCVTVAAGPRASSGLAAADVDAKVRVIVTAGNAGGTARAGSRGLGPVGPSRVRVKRSLAAFLRTSVERWTIAGMLRTRDRVVGFRAPSRGRLRASWRVAGQRVVLATVRTRFSGEGSARLVVRVTSHGAAFLAGAHALRLIAKA